MVKFFTKIILVVVVLAGMYFIFFSAESLEDVFFSTSDFIVRVGVIFVFSFSILLIFRYLILMFFSILQVIKRTAEEGSFGQATDFVTIIVPCFNEEAVILSSLNSLVQQDYPKLEILVIDDGSTDSTYSLAKSLEFKEGERSLKVFSIANRGKSKALNFGIMKSTGSLILAVDADSRLKYTATSLLARHFSNPEVAAVAGSVSVINANTLLTRLQSLEYIQGLNMVKNGQAFLRLVNIIPGPIGMFRKSAMEEVGFYAHDTFAEDCDLTLSLLAKGYKVDFDADAISYTEAPESLNQLLKQRYRWTRGILQAIKKNKKYLWKLRSETSASLTLWYMLVEAIFWPFIHIWGTMLILYLALIGGQNQLLLFWWILFMVLDLFAALYCVVITKEKLSLVAYSVIYRLVFLFIINIAKMFASVEEWFGVSMSWGTLDRKGRI